jgi:hypothetical protein
MAAVFVASFSAAAVLHRDTAVALVLCGVAIATLVLAVFGANVRSPRRGHARPELDRGGAHGQSLGNHTDGERHTHTCPALDGPAKAFRPDKDRQ